MKKSYLSIVYHTSLQKAPINPANVDPIITGSRRLTCYKHSNNELRIQYRTAGVREYWIVNPLKNIVNVYALEHEEKSNLYSFDEPIPVCIYEDFHIRITDLVPIK